MLYGEFVRFGGRSSFCSLSSVAFWVRLDDPFYETYPFPSRCVRDLKFSNKAVHRRSEGDASSITSVSIDSAFRFSWRSSVGLIVHLGPYLTQGLRG